MSKSPSPYDQNLDRNPANFEPLTPLQFLERAAWTFPNKTSVIHGDLKRTWAETRSRCHKLADALAKRGLGKGDTVAVLAANTPEMMELHFGVPLTGAVINTINTRLDAAIIGFILDHGEASAVFVDREFSGVMAEALKIATVQPFVIDIDDPEYNGPGDRIGEMEFEAFLALGDESFPYRAPEDEWDSIALNYTSGTTGDPKGVVYSHRGAYLNSMCNALTWSMPQHPVYLWTLPMFHCNGWCFPWALALQAGVNVCLRQVRASAIFDAIAKHNVDHMCGAPIVLNLIANAKPEEKKSFDHVVKVMMRGNIVMKGYLKNPKSTEAAFKNGWFHSGDLGVMHDDGYIALKDRSKDIIISGGENISSVEVEQTLYRHPSVAEAAVVARPDERWGETPCAFLELKDGVDEPTEEEIIQFCRDNMASFKTPKRVVFGPLPKTSTGKVQKFVLRERAKEL